MPHSFRTSDRQHQPSHLSSQENIRLQMQREEDGFMSKEWWKEFLKYWMTMGRNNIFSAVHTTREPAQNKIFYQTQ